MKAKRASNKRPSLVALFEKQQEIKKCSETSMLLQHFLEISLEQKSWFQFARQNNLRLKYFERVKSRDFFREIQAIIFSNSNHHSFW